MKPETTGPLELGSHEARYVLIDEQGVLRGHADTLHAAREDSEELDPLQATGGVHVVREDRTVVPDAADVDTLGVVDIAAVHEALTADHAILTGEADELDARRPHPPQYAFLYDVADGLRHRAERTREVRELETEWGGLLDD